MKDDACDPVIPPLAIWVRGRARAPPTRKVLHHSNLWLHPNASLSCRLPVQTFSGCQSRNALAGQAGTTKNNKTEKEYSHVTDNFFPNEYT
jgi:hypothetical protein